MEELLNVTRNDFLELAKLVDKLQLKHTFKTDDWDEFNKFWNHIAAHYDGIDRLLSRATAHLAELKSADDALTRLRGNAIEKKYMESHFPINN